MAQLTKNEFKNINSVTVLVDKLTNLITGDQPFTHGYKIQHKTWSKQHGGQNWHVTSMLDARNQYWWFGDIAQNQAELNVLAANLKQSMYKGDENSTFVNVLKILDWGQVYKGCLSYVVTSFEKGKLISNLKDAIQILESDNVNELHRFDGSDLRMDSGMTKVFSLASHKSIIFDSRVASAITLIAYRFLTTQQLNELFDHNILSVGKAPSGSKRHMIKGQKLLARQLGTGITQARYNLLGNWLLNESIDSIPDFDKVKKNWGVLDKSELLRNVEAALFMIGSDISEG